MMSNKAAGDRGLLLFKHVAMERGKLMKSNMMFLAGAALCCALKCLSAAGDGREAEVAKGMAGGVSSAWDVAGPGFGSLPFGRRGGRRERSQRNKCKCRRSHLLFSPY